jgi:hypothetical protein
MANDEDVTLESSTSMPDGDAGQPAAEAAPVVDDGAAASPSGGEGSDRPAGEAAAQPDQQPDASDDGAKRATTDDAIAYLTGEKPAAKKPADGTEVDEDGKATKQSEKAAEKPAKEKVQPARGDDSALTPEDMRAPRKTRERIEKLLSDRKAAVTELETLKPQIEAAAAFDSVIKTHHIEADLDVCEDGDIAGAVMFQAALKRLFNGKGTEADKATLTRAYQQLDIDREALGIPSSAPKLDVAKLEAALAKAETEFEFDDLRKEIGGLKAAKPEPAKVAPVRPATAPVVTQPAAQERSAEADAEDRLYETEATEQLKAEGVKNPPEYFSKQLYPVILSNLRQRDPNRNPVVWFQKLSPQARYDQTIKAHAIIKAREQKLKPSTDKGSPSHRPMAGGGSKPAWSNDHAPATTTEAAIQLLSGGN